MSKGLLIISVIIALPLELEEHRVAVKSK
jgi:hypothetical protein